MRSGVYPARTIALSYRITGRNLNPELKGEHLHAGWQKWDVYGVWIALPLHRRHVHRSGRPCLLFGCGLYSY